MFLAFGAVLLSQGFYKDLGIELDPLCRFGLWTLPTATEAFVIHAGAHRDFEHRLAARLARRHRESSGR